MDERLQKVLAAAGVASRRHAEQLIAAGRVTVNGRQVREPGVKADPARDDVRLDGRPVRPPAAHTYLLLHKPPGYTSTVADPHARNTVMQLLPGGTGRVFPVGRLDRDSEGLLLFTDDGELTARLLHPRYHVPKEYAVLVRGRITERLLRRLREGIDLDGTRTAPATVEPGDPPSRGGAPESGERRGAQAGPTRPFAAEPRGGSDTVWLRFVLTEGKKRQIRAMCARVGLEVVRLIRTRMGPIALGDLRPGAVRRLQGGEVAKLRAACGLAASAGPAPHPRREAGAPRPGQAQPSHKPPHHPNRAAAPRTAARPPALSRARPQPRRPRSSS